VSARAAGVTKYIELLSFLVSKTKRLRVIKLPRLEEYIEYMKRGYYEHSGFTLWYITRRYRFRKTGYYEHHESSNKEFFFLNVKGSRLVGAPELLATSASFFGFPSLEVYTPAKFPRMMRYASLSEVIVRVGVSICYREVANYHVGPLQFKICG